MRVKSTFIILSALLLVLCAGGTHAEKAKKDAPAPAKEFKDSDPVAKVNGKPITYGDYQRQYTNMKQRLFISRGQEMTPEQGERLKTGIIDSLIGAELLAQEAGKQKIPVTDQDIETQLDEFAKQAGGRDKLAEQLQKAGFSLDVFKEKIKVQLAVQKLIEKESADAVKPTEAEKKEYYENHPSEFDRPLMIHVAHILARLDAQATAEDEAKAKAKIEEILKKVQAGADFAQVAREHSEGPSAPQGGDLGWVTKGRMAPEFEKAAFDLKAGEISGVVKTSFGFHIIKVYEIKEAMHLPFEEVEPQVTVTLMRQKMGPWVQKYVQDLRSQAKVEVFI